MHIGLIGGIGPAATVVYYQRLCARMRQLGAPLELTIVQADIHTLITNNLADLRDEQAAVYVALIERLKAAGADVIQLDEPWLQARPEQAARYGVKAINRALQGVGATTVVHLCFGYAALVKDKPSGYSFLPQLADSTAMQISIEAAQPGLDLGILSALSNKTIMLGVLDLGSDEVETADTVAQRVRAGLKHVPAERLVLAPDCGMKYLPRARAFAKLKALAEGTAMVRRELQG